MVNEQINGLKATIDKLSGELGEVSQMATRHFDELHDAVNNVASHTLAMEAIISAILVNIDIDQKTVTSWIRAKTAEYSSPEHGESAAEAIARDFLGNKGA
ncbi:hypothetical protein [Thalassospira sp. MCCC 1A01428]|uniref:hypothetical protein n=1 Tax=Thalassospira sp. MCCC 1A01428 TaxID=1470575 RepID=UPI000A1FE9E3|nr:hypothetical protein [Thalassospira sp. MCCC 1A01428]OSQ46298.1 hypothetical protein THS27_00165 [Thalassospira sp. MCCC 1A01428]